MNDNHTIHDDMSFDDIAESINSITRNDTMQEGSTTAQNAESSQQDSLAPNSTSNEAIAHTAQENNSFAAFDSLRHKFNTRREIKKTEYIGGLFPRKGITVIAGASGVGKTTFEQKVIHDLSLGGNILDGFTKNEPKRKSIIIAGELGEEGLTERAQEYGWHSDTNLVEVVDLLDFEEKGYSLIINEEAGMANIEHLAQTPNLDLLFLDSFGMFYTGKETDNDALRSVFHWLLRIARKYNIAIVIIHHSRKRLSTEQQKPLTLDDLIGGNAISRYAHRVIAIEYNAKLKANTVTCLKSWGPYFKTFTYCKKPGFYGGEPYLEFDLEPGEIEPTTNKNNNKAPASDAAIQRNMVIAFLKGKERNQATTKEISNILDVKENDSAAKNTLLSTLKRMIDNGEIIRVKRGAYALPEPKATNEETEAAQPDNEETTFDFDEEE